MASPLFQISSSFRSAIALGTLAFFPIQGVRAAISIDSFSAVTNDRFADSPSFVADAYDLSGVGRSAGGWWVVMISPNVFLTAVHAPVLVSETLTFYAGNDPTSVSVTATVGGTMQIGNTDLLIGYLDFPISDTIATYTYTTVPLTEATFLSSGLYGDPVLLSGLSPTGTGYGANSATRQAVGVNRLEGFQEDFTAGGTSSVNDVLISVKNQPGDAGFIYQQYEASLSSGDSGAPLFLTSGGELVLGGINLAVGPENIGSVGVRDLSAFTYVGNSAAEIAAYVTLHAVPEPSAAILGVLGGLVLLRRRR